MATKAATKPTSPGPTLTWDQVAAWRIQRHHLDQRAPLRDLVAITSEVCGWHAQLMSSAELSTWARVDEVPGTHVAEALWESRDLVKTWAMRGTLHLLPAREYGLWQAALSTYRHFLKPAWTKASGVSPAALDRLVDAIATALDGPPLTREELADRVGELTSAELGDKLRGSWGSLLKPAAFRGRLCFAPGDGQKVRFTRPDRWLGAAVGGDEASDWDGAAALAEITRRFLAAYGPVEREDLARWWATTPAAAAKLITGLADEVMPVDVEGRSGWMLRADWDTAAAATADRVVRLIPAFDPYIIGATRHASQLLHGGDANRDRVYRNQGWISAVVLVNGRMEGVWRHERKGRRIAVEIEPFGRLPAWARKGVEAEAERLAVFLDGALEMSWVS